MIVNDMVRGLNMKAKNNWIDTTIRPLTEVLVVTAITDGTITAKNGDGDVYDGTPEQFQPVFQNLICFHYADVDIQRANDAHNGTSWSPERRGYLYSDGYVSHMEDLDRHFSAFVTDGNREELIASLEWYRKKYLTMMWAYLHSHSNVISAMITGPSNFPTRRAQKRSDWASKHHDAWVKWQKTAQSRLERQFNPRVIANAPISSDDADAVEKLRKKIDTLEATQALMKSANKIIGSKKLSDDDKLAKLAEAGISNALAYTLLHPAASYLSPGFARYQLSNNNAEIRRLKVRLADVERKRHDTTQELTVGEITITDNVEANRVQVFFPGEPEKPVIDFLKSHGFRWTPSIRAWQQYRSARAWNLACDAAKMALGANN